MLRKHHTEEMEIIRIAHLQLLADNQAAGNLLPVNSMIQIGNGNGLLRIQLASLGLLHIFIQLIHVLLCKKIWILIVVT